MPEKYLILVSTPLYALLIGFEILLSNWQHKPYYSFKDSFTNFLLMLFNGGIDLLFRSIYFGILIYFYDHRWVISYENVFLYWFLLFILEDFVFYVLHYFDHYVRFFWAIHVTHHSSQKFNLTTGFRSSVFQPLYRFVYFIPLALAGFQPADILLMYSITQIYGILVHTEYDIRLGWLEQLLVTPSNHRVHHASNTEYLDKNMGMCLIIWDKIFGTYQEQLPTVKPHYGITTPLENTSIFYTIFHEWVAIFKDVKSAKTTKQAIYYLLKPPGWKP